MPADNPFFFHYCISLGYWNFVGIFDSGLIVFQEEFEEKDEILKNDVQFVLYKQFAWPLHWCIGTSLVEIHYDLGSALKR